MPRKYIKKRVRKYRNVELDLAIEAIENGLSIRQAAKEFHVPYTTLRPHATGDVIYERIGINHILIFYNLISLTIYSVLFHCFDIIR